MRILAIETTAVSGTIAVLEQDRCLINRPLDPAGRSAQSLAPAIVELLREAGWQPKEVQLVAVATGPGSFTGLRVGVTTAKMFAYAVGAAVACVNTLEAIAWQVPTNTKESSATETNTADLWTVLDAQRNQLFCAKFGRVSAAVANSGGTDNPAHGNWRWNGETLLLDAATWLAELAAGMSVSGPGLAKLATQVPQGVTVVDPTLWPPQAATIGQLAWRDYQTGQRQDLTSLIPQYFRPSAAEEKRDR